MGTFLHGTNTETHTCIATSEGNNKDESDLVTVEGMYSFLFITIIKNYSNAITPGLIPVLLLVLVPLLLLVEGMMRINPMC